MLQTIDRTNWQAFIEDEGLAVLMLGKTDCAACATWTEELNELLAQEHGFEQVRFGKLDLKQPGMIGFKKANPWLAEADVLPYNIIYRDGEPVKRWAGGGRDRLENRLRRFV